MLKIAQWKREFIKQIALIIQLLCWNCFIWGIEFV